MPFLAPSGILNRRGFFGEVAQAQEFSPSDISNLQLWLRSDYGITTEEISYISQIAISGCSPSTSNGTYIGSNTSFYDENTGNNIYYEDGAWYLYDSSEQIVTFANFSSLDDTGAWEVFAGSSFGSATNSYTNFTGVTEWLDKSDNSFNFTGVASGLSTNQINSYPAVYFDGSGYLTSPSDLLDNLSGLSFFFVWKVYNVGSNLGLFGSSNYSDIEIISNPMAQIRIRNEDYDSSFMSNEDWFDLDSGYSISSFIAENENGAAYKNGSVVIGTDGANIELPTGSGIAYDLGRYAYPSYTLYSKFYLAEFIIYGKKLNATELGQVHNYLNTRYAIY